MMMSQASAVSNPPPIATPLTAAISGLSRSKRWLSPANPVAGRGPRRPAACTLRSLPAEKARSPAPVMMPTHSSGSAANSFHTASNSQCASLCSAFMTSGRLIVTMRSRPSSATVQKRYSGILVSPGRNHSAQRTRRARNAREGASTPSRPLRILGVLRVKVFSFQSKGSAPMKLSTDHILTTHVGSLPRPHDLLAMLEAREAGHGFDEAAFEARLAAAVRDIVEKQVACGIDSVCDGEQSKISYTFYVRHRLAGIGAFRGAEVDKPPQTGAHRDLLDHPDAAERLIQARRRTSWFARETAPWCLGAESSGA